MVQLKVGFYQNIKGVVITKLSKFIQDLQSYLEYRGDNEVTLVNRDDGEEFTIQYVDGFKDECSIVIQGETEEEDEND